MNPFISKLLFYRKSPEQVADEEYLEGWEGIPESDKQRRKLSAAQLAIHLSKCKKDSPAYLLYDHELNRRLANIQAIPAWVAIAMIFVGLGVGWLLSQYKPFESKTSLDIIAEHIKKHDEAKAENKAKQATDNMELPASPVLKTIILEPKNNTEKQISKNKESKQNNPKR